MHSSFVVALIVLLLVHSSCDVDNVCDDDAVFVVAAAVPDFDLLVFSSLVFSVTYFLTEITFYFLSAV